MNNNVGSSEYWSVPPVANNNSSRLEDVVSTVSRAAGVAVLFVALAAIAANFVI